MSNLSLLNGNTLELHYWFGDESHNIDAIVQNKCECEFLCVLREIASSFNAEILIETEPFADGGLRRWFKVITKEENKKGAITAVIITTLMTGIFVTPLTTAISTTTGKIIENIFEDKELKELEKEKLKLEIDKLKQETQNKDQILNQSNVIKKRKSNFYEILDKYPKVSRVSFVVANPEKMHLVDEKTVYRKDFKGFILVSDELEPIENENATIEIISPVLKKGKYKWMGIYNGLPIHFNMKSKEFKALIQSGKVLFKNGTSINCQLNIRRKIDNEGEEEIVGYDVLRVNSYFENEKPIETPEGKSHRKNIEAWKQQTNLFETN